VIDLWKAAAPAAPDNEAVRAHAADLARRAGRPAVAWKDYVAKARASLVAELAKAAGDEDEEGAAPDEGDADTDAGDTTADDLTDDSAAHDTTTEDNSADDGDQNDGDDDAAADAADTPADIAGRLATLAASDPEALQAAHDALAALGAICDPDNCAGDAADKHLGVDDLAKLDGGSLVEALLAKALPRVEALERRIAEQDALIERIAASPQPPRTAASVHARAVGKADDADPGAETASDVTPAEAQKAFAALSPDERAFLLMKASLRQPIPLP
jgi:hypothetical protein